MFFIRALAFFKKHKNIYALKGDISIEKGTHIVGSLFGREISLSKECTMDLKSACWNVFSDNINKSSQSLAEDHPIASPQESINENVKINDNFFYDIYPNPFKEATTIVVTSTFDDMILLKIYNYMGHSVADLYDGEIKSGQQLSIEFNTSNLLAGIYFGVLETSKNKEVRKMMIVK